MYGPTLKGRHFTFMYHNKENHAQTIDVHTETNFIQVSEINFIRQENSSTNF